MKLSNFVEGVEILLKYYDDTNKRHVSTEWAMTFYMPATDRPMTKADVAKLRKLGWSQCDESLEPREDLPNCDKPIYDRSKDWAAYSY